MSVWRSALPDARAWFVSDLTADRFAESALAFTGPELVRLDLTEGRPTITARHPACAPALEERRGYVALVTPDGTELTRCTTSRLADLATFRATVLTSLASPTVSPTPTPTPTRPPPPPTSTRRLLPHLLTELRPFRPTLALILLLIALTSILTLVPPYLTKTLVDGLLRPGASTTSLLLTVTLMALTTTSAHLLSHLRRLREAHLKLALSHRLRSRAFESAARFSLADANRATPAALASTVLSDSTQLVALLSSLLLPATFHMLTLAGILVSLAWLSPYLALLVLLPAPLVALAIRRHARAGQLLVTRTWTEQMMLAQRVNSFMQGFRVVKAFGVEDEQSAAFCAHSDAARARELDLEVHSSAYAPLLSLVTGAGSLIIWGAGGWLVLRGQLGVGSLVAYVAYLAMIYTHAQALSHLASAAPRIWSAARQYLELLDVEPAVRPSPAPVRLARARGEIRVERVCFSYTPGRQVLHDVELAIAPGEMIGLVGRSGSGKTTLVNLIARLYDPSAGRVVLDGVPLAELDIGDLRRAIGMVLQQPFLFGGTVLENLRMGRAGATLREVCEAADRAQAHDFILSLPDGYDTRLGDRVALSAGEQQRLTIARALLHDPQVLILDEATASLDAETERAVQEAIAELTRGRTTIAIAHRTATLARADRLVRLDAGRIAEVTPGSATAPAAYPPLAWLAAAPPHLVPVRAFPLTAPAQLIALRPRGGASIGIIEDAAALPADARAALERALAAEELVARVLAIRAITHESGWYHWDVETSAGARRFRTRQTWSEPPAARTSTGLVVIRGEDGVRYVADPDALDAASRALLRVLV